MHIPTPHKCLTLKSAKILLQYTFTIYEQFDNSKTFDMR